MKQLTPGRLRDFELTQSEADVLKKLFAETSEDMDFINSRVRVKTKDKTDPAAYIGKLLIERMEQLVNGETYAPSTVLMYGQMNKKGALFPVVITTSLRDKDITPEMRERYLTYQHGTNGATVTLKVNVD